MSLVIEKGVLEDFFLARSVELDMPWILMWLKEDWGRRSFLGPAWVENWLWLKAYVLVNYFCVKSHAKIIIKCLFIIISHGSLEWLGSASYAVAVRWRLVPMVQKSKMASAFTCLAPLLGVLKQLRLIGHVLLSMYPLYPGLPWAYSKQEISE